MREFIIVVDLCRKTRKNYAYRYGSYTLTIVNARSISARIEAIEVSHIERVHRLELLRLLRYLQETGGRGSRSGIATVTE